MKRLFSLLVLAASACATIPPAQAGPIAGLGQVASVDSLRVRPLEIVEDSRCPINAVCVWAGRLIVRTEVRGGAWREVLDLELGKPQQIADGELTLVAAEPGKLAGAETDSRSYRFTYAFDGGL